MLRKPRRERPAVNGRSGGALTPTVLRAEDQDRPCASPTRALHGGAFPAQAKPMRNVSCYFTEHLIYFNETGFAPIFTRYKR